MIFSSPIYIYIYLPLAIILYFSAQKIKWLGLFPIVVLSFCFYAYWKPPYLLVLLLSIVVNYSLGQAISSLSTNITFESSRRRSLYYIGLFFNILLLCYFKYTNFGIDIINNIFGCNIEKLNIILPIGISFYTFQQIAYISDVFHLKHDPKNDSLSAYSLFIGFFPQAIAGPIVHHKEMMPQFFNPHNRVLRKKNIYRGILFFSFGLFKKIVIADNIAPVANFCFSEISILTFNEALIGSIAYTLQLYFDFSGYCDMAIGSALFFNIKLPYNFNSPYKATSVQDFWRRWHMTLSRWLRDYIYIPLGGNRKGTPRLLLNLFLTFLIGGIWHGAGFTFIFWGVLHGSAVCIHRVFKSIVNITVNIYVSRIITFIFIVIAWIPFRADNASQVKKFFDALCFQSGIGVTDNFISGVSEKFMFAPSLSVICIVGIALLFTVFFMPNSQDIIKKYWKSKILFFYASVLLSVGLVFVLMPNYVQEFIYFNF